jgi:lysozyme
VRYRNLAQQLIVEFEGIELEAYKCPAGVWTIGVGSTKNVKEVMKITMEEAMLRLSEDMQDAETCVNLAVKTHLTEGQRAALISFVFNLGCGNFQSSTLLRVLNEGDYTRAANQFLRWDKVKGKVVAGLTRRRMAEKEMFDNA